MVAKTVKGAGLCALGLISVAEDCETILVSHNKVPTDVVGRLIAANGKLIKPGDPRHHPHPRHLWWHRENVFGRALDASEAPW